MWDKAGLCSGWRTLSALCPCPSPVQEKYSYPALDGCPKAGAVSPAGQCLAGQRRLFRPCMLDIDKRACRSTFTRIELLDH